MSKIKTHNYHSDLLFLEPSLCSNEKKFKFKIIHLFMFIFGFLLFAGSFSAVSVLQNDMLNLYIKNDTELIEENLKSCNLLDFSNINLISHPLSLLLLLIYMFLFWRRSCCLKCLFARPAPPMIVHPFKKSNRFLTAIVYGIIAFKVMPIVKSAISKSSASDIWSLYVKDPSGLFKLTVRIIEVLLAALRYYPPLIAFCADSIFIYITSTLYMLVDIGSNIYVEGKCEGFDDPQPDADEKEIRIFGVSKIVFTIFKDLPQFVLLSLTTTFLLYNTIKKIQSIYGSKDKRKVLCINEDIKFYSIHDIKYCVDLYTKHEKPPIQIGKLKKLFHKLIYKWEPNFKFSSRIINSHVVALLSLYYFFMEVLFYGILVIKSVVGTADGALTNFLQVFGGFEVNIPFDKNIKVIEEHIAGYVVAVVLSYIICNIQCFLGLRSIQKVLLNLYKGRKEKIPLLDSNSSISNGNTHFAGFLVGFLLNGFLFIFAFFFLIVLLVYYASQFLTWDDIGQFILKIVPIITVFIFKFVFNFICSRFIFLQEKSKLLALDNFRAFSVFVYITFFFDCFVGAINALVRLLIGILGSLFFMPRIGYSFLGRQIENFDAGFRVSAGYYQMEYTHSHPVLLTFCALLYYKRLVYKLDDINSRDLVQMIRNRKSKVKIEPNDKGSDLEKSMIEINKQIDDNFKSKLNSSSKKKIYKKQILNRWYLAVTLVNNNNLIFHRKESHSYRKLMLFEKTNNNLQTVVKNTNDKSNLKNRKIGKI